MVAKLLVEECERQYKAPGRTCASPWEHPGACAVFPFRKDDTDVADIASIVADMLQYRNTAATLLSQSYNKYVGL